MTATQSGLRLEVPLPPTYRVHDILNFHRRDTQAVAERVSEDGLEKGLLWQGRPALLRVRFHGSVAEASLEVDADPACTVLGPHRFEAMVLRMLGLAQDIEAFERQHAEHPEMGRLIAMQTGLRVPVAATPFEALAWAITGQQISVAAAVSLRRKLITASGLHHQSGLMCHPDAERLAALPESVLKAAGFSSAKAATLLSVASKVASGEWPMDAWADAPPVERIVACLRATRGIGPWTINYTLLRGFGWLDGSLHGDVAVRRGLQALLGEPDPISERRAQEWLAGFMPWRALVAAHLWAARSTLAY